MYELHKFEVLNVKIVNKDFSLIFVCKFPKMHSGFSNPYGGKRASKLQVRPL